MTQKPCIITLGKFDGVHKGHKSLIDTAVSFAHEKEFRKEFLAKHIDFTEDFLEIYPQPLGAEINMDVRLVTFFPHPYTTIKPEPFVPLMNSEDRLEHLKNLGADYVDVLTFDKEFAKQNAEAFCKKMVEKFNMKCLFIGYDCTIGSDKVGKMGLQVLGKKYGFCVYALPPVFAEKTIISSSQIREAIQNGDVALAKDLLGKPFCVHGTIVHGAKRGGDLLNFPTANMKINTIVPKRGVYATQCKILTPEYEGRVFNAVTNIGYNPTFGNTEQSIETYLFNFSDDIYHKDMELCFIDFLREEKKFTCIEELRAQIEADTQKATDLFTFQETLY